MSSSYGDRRGAGRSTVKQRAAAARALAAATKSWAAAVASAAAGTQWRPKSCWIQQSDGIRYADLTHVCTGSTRTIRSDEGEALEVLRARLLDEGP